MQMRKPEDLHEAVFVTVALTGKIRTCDRKHLLLCRKTGCGIFAAARFMIFCGGETECIGQKNLQIEPL